MMQRRRRITKAYFNLARLQYAPLINKLAFKIGRNIIRIEELRAHADVELLKCLICYNGGGSFMTFLFSRLSGSMRHARDAEYRARRIKSISHESMMNISEPHRNIDSKMIVQDCLMYLSVMERKIIVGLFLEEKTMRDASNDYGISISNICHIKDRAISKMKQKCGVGQE